MNGKVIGSKPLYVNRAQRKEDRKAQLEHQFLVSESLMLLLLLLLWSDTNNEHTTVGPTSSPALGYVLPSQHAHSAHDVCPTTAISSAPCLSNISPPNARWFPSNGSLQLSTKCEFCQAKRRRTKHRASLMFYFPPQYILSNVVEINLHNNPLLEVVMLQMLEVALRWLEVVMLRLDTHVNRKLLLQ